MLFLILGVFLLLGGLVTLIAVQNLTLLVHLSLFSWHTPDLPMGVWFAGAFLFGAVALYLVSVLSAMSDQRHIKALRQQVLALAEKGATASPATVSSSAEQRAVDRLSSADTGPLFSVSPGMNTSLPSGRIPTSPLPPQQDFPQ